MPVLQIISQLFRAWNDCTEYAGVTQCDFPYNLPCNVGKRNPLQVAEDMIHVAISSYNLQ